ncbi:MAG: hypothetical protein IH840_16635 [Candidatus Heimdallarchaeota archaeon]|nr:hypothetical protein [Candidatus Heimdallarchaeota archaeon]
MSSSENKQTVQKYCQAINERDWETIAYLLHDDFSHFFDEDTAEALPEWKDTPYYHFLKALGFEDTSLGRNINAYSNKIQYLEILKFLAEIWTDWRILSLIADEYEVWVYLSTVFNEPHQYGINMEYHMRFKMHEGKIIAFLGRGLYLGSLIQYGSIILEKDRGTEIARYLDSLHNMGLIPDMSTLIMDK